MIIFYSFLSYIIGIFSSQKIWLSSFFLLLILFIIFKYKKEKDKLKPTLFLICLFFTFGIIRPFLYLSGKEFVYKPKSFEYAITVQSRNGTLKEMNIEQLSSGEKQIVALLSYIYLFVKQPCTIIIDEPELSLSVPWQETILEDIVKSQRCNQLIVATQSPFVYDNSLSCYAHSMEEFLGVE